MTNLPSDDMGDPTWIELCSACSGLAQQIIHRPDLPWYARRYITQWLQGVRSEPPSERRSFARYRADETGASELCCAIALINALQGRTMDEQTLNQWTQTIHETLGVAARKIGYPLSEAIADALESERAMYARRFESETQPSARLEARAAAQAICMRSASASAYRRSVFSTGRAR